MSEHMENSPQDDRMPARAIDLVSSVLEEFDVQPVLFIGAGLSRRYIGAPGWDMALEQALTLLGSDAPSYSYFIQKFEGDRPKIGSEIGDRLFEWAWSKGKDYFPTELYKSSDRHVFLKYEVAKNLSDLERRGFQTKNEFVAEIAAIKSIRPHAIITTNYDHILEEMFDGYEPIVGGQVLRYDLNSFGEIFHIHGIADDPSGMVLTEQDYARWAKQSRYFSAKLLTYFAEHPVFIFGYSLSDPNVRTILTDIGRIVATEDGLIENVVQVVWHDDMKNVPSHSELIIKDEEDDREYRLAVLNTDSFADIFEALAARHELKQVNPALLRSLAARIMKLTRKDIPSGTVEVDYATLERVVRDDAVLPSMLGLTFADNDNKTHPFTLSQVADELGLQHWTALSPALKRIEAVTGVNLRSSDNRYHERIKTGKKESSATRKWSHDAVQLFRDVLRGGEFEIKL